MRGGPGLHTDSAFKAELGRRGAQVYSRNRHQVCVLAALFDLVNHPYWSRIWIIQEIAVARTVHIYYGGATFTWDLFSSVMRDIRMQSVGSLFVLSSLDQIPQALPFRGSDRVLSISATRSAVEMKFSTPL